MGDSRAGRPGSPSEIRPLRLWSNTVSYYGYEEEQARPSVDSRTLWAGGLATALVAALVGVVAVLVLRGVFGLPVIAPGNTNGALDYIGAVWLALFGAVGALLATALAHLLLLVAPRPMAFFGWIIALVTVVFVVWPFTVSETLTVRLTSAAVYLVMGIAIGSLVSGMATRALRTRKTSPQHQQPPYPPGGTGYPGYYDQ
ncbi:hypothetical protein SAMN05421630_105120 [Prauserella marina]|uniref:Uncharacterized protein n=1 Tax=Prauserella marina TaxID=530584 RepID=A0A1G6R683_9PSEU|nr:hypothetical protein DES30_105119 [Prauserella marina]SDD00048.1 hypothetical protein SAMN05421630_105120 [Prauserella marina]